MAARRASSDTTSHADQRRPRLINRVSVEASFFKRMSATENLSYAARFYGLAPSQTRRQIPEILEAVGLPTERANAPMQELSRGMQQKVALARALLTSPTLLCTHDMAEAAAPADRVGILHAGRLLALEPTSTLCRRFDAASLEDAFLVATARARTHEEAA
jgi:ABC-2 type transport system ATP-binding protein